MLPITTTLSIANHIVNTINDRLGIEPISTKGSQLKKDLGLGQFKHVVIQKIIGIGLPIYVVTFDSRFPYRFITYPKVMKLQSTRFLKLKIDKDEYLFSKLKITPPFPIEDTRMNLLNNSIILLRDISGEYFNSKDMIDDFNESINKYYVYKI